MVHTAAVLPPELVERLKRDAEASGRGLSGEIRERLQRTYQAEDAEDPETDRFVAAVKTLSGFLERDLGTKWHGHDYALAAFRAGITALLARYVLAGDERLRPGYVEGDPDDPPDVVGRTHARRVKFE
jgi:hypothetical protein